MANRALAAKAEKAKRQRLGIDAVAPRWSEKAGRFRPTEASKAPYVMPGGKAAARALIASTVPLSSVVKAPPGRRVEAIGKGRRQVTRGCYGDGRRRGAVLDASCYATGDVLMVRV